MNDFPFSISFSIISLFSIKLRHSLQVNGPDYPSSYALLNSDDYGHILLISGTWLEMDY